MKNIHLIPTDKLSKLKQNKITKKLSLVNKGIDLTAYTPINIYITSDDKFIKDEYITDGNEVIKATPKLVNAQDLIDRRDWKKIILTTDTELIADGVQAMDDEFLEWFVKNPSCEEVNIVKEKQHIGEEVDESYPKGFFDYKIIIPSEKSKQETLEEAMIKNGYHDRKNDTLWREGVNFGTKWQAERMFSKEDLISFAHFYFKEEFNSTMQTSKSTDEIFKDWFEQFKNK